MFTGTPPYPVSAARTGPRSTEDERGLSVLCHLPLARDRCASEKTATKLKKDITFRMRVAGNFPKHWTLCEFHRQHRDDVWAVFAYTWCGRRAWRVRLGVGGLKRQDRYLVRIQETQARLKAEQ